MEFALIIYVNGWTLVELRNDVGLGSLSGWVFVIRVVKIFNTLRGEVVAMRMKWHPWQNKSGVKLFFLNDSIEQREFKLGLSDSFDHFLI